MADEILSLQDLNSKSLQRASDESFDETQKNSFLARIQLMTSAAKICKSGKFPINNWALIRDSKHVDLGSTVDVLVLSWRHMALRWGEDTVACYDHTNDLYLEIQEAANMKEEGNMWGYQALLWVPKSDSFATFFAGSPTARRAFVDLKSLMDKPCTLGSKEIKGKKNTWYGPTFDSCSTEFPLPPKADYLREMNKFNSPQEAPELAEQDSREL